MLVQQDMQVVLGLATVSSQSNAMGKNLKEFQAAKCKRLCWRVGGQSHDFVKIPVVIRQGHHVEDSLALGICWGALLVELEDPVLTKLQVVLHSSKKINKNKKDKMKAITFAGAGMGPPKGSNGIAGVDFDFG